MLTINNIGNLFSCLLPLIKPCVVLCSHCTSGLPVTTMARCLRLYCLIVLVDLGMAAPNRRAV